MAIGAEHQDKSNVKRFARKSRDRGDTWFMTYQTIQNHRPHPAEFPIRLPEMCIKLHGVKPDTLVYDPFMGSGNTALVCISLGVNFVGTEISKEYVEMAEENIRNFMPLDKVSDDSLRQKQIEDRLVRLDEF
jgi:site-specific DNA-methyltransferase (adenine-specific)